MRTLATLFLMLCIPFFSVSANPDLVIVISLDQYPYEYLTRFRSYLHGGLGMLLEKGAVFTNATYKHAECITGPGHTVILSGTYGDMNGIVMNNWFDRTTHRTEYCVDDESVSILGAQGHGRSPRNLLQFTYGDMLRLHSGFASRVVSLSNKDRAAILLGGRLPTEAFWMADSVFVSSTYYMTALPEWVRQFNASRPFNRYFGSVWKQTLPDSAFRFLDRDDAPYETDHDGLGRTFPHRITGNDRTKITHSFYSAVLSSPYGAIALTELAKRAVTAEHLGQRGATDLLCLSYSSTDYVGHAFGPQSHEVLEMTVAIDRTIGDLFSFIDSTIGLQNCLIALSSDHGVCPIPEYVMAHQAGVDAGRVSTDTLEAACESALGTAFGPAEPNARWIASITDHNIYLDYSQLQRANVDKAKAAALVVRTLTALRGVARAWNLDAPIDPLGGPMNDRVLRSYYPARSGDVFYILRPFFLEGEAHGTGHGDPYEYNTHVPLLLMGPSVRPGTYNADASPADLAPTLSALTGVEFPTGREGRVLSEAIR